jgi:hypothetical protein
VTNCRTLEQSELNSNLGTKLRALGSVKPRKMLLMLPILLLMQLQACKLTANGLQSDPVKVNHAPVALDQILTVNDNATLAVTVSASDEDNDTLTYEILTQPGHGTLTGTAPNFVYAPSAQFNLRSRISHLTSLPILSPLQAHM